MVSVNQEVKFVIKNFHRVVSVLKIRIPKHSQNDRTAANGIQIIQKKMDHYVAVHDVRHKWRCTMHTILNNWQFSHQILQWNNA